MYEMRRESLSPGDPRIALRRAGKPPSASVDRLTTVTRTASLLGKYRYASPWLIPASAATSDIVAAGPLRAKTFIAASIILSRASARTFWFAVSVLGIYLYLLNE